VERGPQQRDHRQGDAGLLRAQQQERVRRVAEGEEGDDEQIAPQRRRQRCGGFRGTRSGDSHRLAHAHHEDDDAGQRGQRGEREHEPQVVAPQEQGGRDQRTRDRSRVVHRTMESIGAPEIRGRRHLGEEGVAWRAAQPLADAVGGADGEDVPRRRCGRDQGTREGRQAIPGDDQWLSPRHAVGDAAGGQAGQARH